MKQLLMIAAMLSFYSNTVVGAERLWYAVDWEYATERADDTELLRSDVRMHRIYYGDTSGEYNEVTQVGANVCWWGLNPWSTAPATEKYAVVTTVDTEARESGYSPEFKVGIATDLGFFEKLPWAWYGMRCWWR